MTHALAPVCRIAQASDHEVEVPADQSEVDPINTVDALNALSDEVLSVRIEVAMVRADRLPRKLRRSSSDGARPFLAKQRPTKPENRR